MRKKIPKLFIWDYTLCMTVYWMCTGTLIAKLTESLGMSVALANIVVALPSMTLTLELIGGFAYSKTEKKHNYVRLTSAIWRMLVPCVFYSALLPKGIGAAFMLVCYVVMVSTYHLCMPAYNTWLINSTAGKVKSNYLSVRDTIFIALFTVTTFVYGMIADGSINADKAALGFGIVATIELGFALWSLFFLFKRLPPPDKAKNIKRSIKDILQKPFETKGFVLVLLQNIIWNFGAMFIGNFAAIYQVRVLHIGFSQIVLWSTIGNFARVCFTPVFAKLADKIGWKKTTQVTLLPVILHALCWMCATQENIWFILPIASIMGAIPNAGLGIGLFKYQVAYSQPETRSLTFSICSAASGVASLLGTTLCTAFVAVLSGMAAQPYYLVFAIGIFFVFVTIAIIGITPYSEKT